MEKDKTNERNTFEGFLEKYERIEEAFKKEGVEPSSDMVLLVVNLNQLLGKEVELDKGEIEKIRKLFEEVEREDEEIEKMFEVLKEE